LKMVRDGVVVVLPLYLLVLVLELMVVMEPPTFICHCTLVIARLEVTVHTCVFLLMRWMTCRNIRINKNIAIISEFTVHILLKHQITKLIDTFVTFFNLIGVPTVQVQQPSYSVTTGNTMTLGCTVTSNLAITSVQWQRNVGGSITTINSNTNCQVLNI
jgi:hypothetical protein